MPNDTDGMHHPSAPSADRSGVQINPTGDFLHGEDCWREPAHHQCAINLIEWQWDTIAKLRRECKTAQQNTTDWGMIVRGAKEQRNEARAVARRLYAHNRTLAAALLAVVPPTDDNPGTCEDCGATLEAVRPGKKQCPDCGVCERCGYRTYKGVCMRNEPRDVFVTNVERGISAATTCQRCGHVTYDGVCSGSCYPCAYSEQP